MAYGIKIAKPGTDVLEETDPESFLVHTGYNTLKISQEGYGTTTVVTEVQTTIDITHNLGYNPVVLFYFTHPEDSKWHQAPSRADINQGYSYYMGGGWVYKDTNTITLKLNDSGSAPIPSPPGEVTVEYKYYIFIDPATDSWYE